MKKPEFAERQYEVAACIELALGRASPFVPTQSIEAYIGIDAAADPVKCHAIWRILSVQIPRRIQLSPALWPALPPQFHNQIPGQFCSLFIQFKRPVFQDSKRAKYHSRIGGPYFEVKITPHQQEALWQFQRRVQARAIVRYASPAFWSRDDFDRYDEHRQVLANSAFIPPARIKTHRKWMYAGQSGKVVLNPDPEDGEGEAWEAVVAEMTGVAARQSLREHVRSLAASLSDEGDLRPAVYEQSWLTRIVEYGKFSRADTEFLVDLSVVARAAEKADSTWIVMLQPENDWKIHFSGDRIGMWSWLRWFWWSGQL